MFFHKKLPKNESKKEATVKKGMSSDSPQRSRLVDPEITGAQYKFKRWSLDDTRQYFWWSK